MKPAVLCVDRHALAEQNIPFMGKGLYNFELLDIPADKFHFINREIVDTQELLGLEAEIGRHFPQILGYVMITSGNKILSYARKHSGEARLLGNRSIGFGGHVDLDDAIFAGYDEHGGVLYSPSFPDIIRHSVVRELSEELGLSIDMDEVNFTGLIIDTTNPVGSVHAGLLCTVEVLPKQVTSTLETQDLQWLTIDELKANDELYESWSQIVIQKLPATPVALS